ncbi:MAG: PEP-CTERM sorting domain-containing protein [Nitrospira sp.]|nr:PEP-CTERM sorting domain-containing protein [Nitrospira sp.]
MVVQRSEGVKKGLVIGLMTFLLVQAPAWALPIVFNLGYGGTVSYGGGASAFTTTNGVVRSVGNGTTTINITGGDLDFATGLYTGGASTGTGFQNLYAAGGSFSIYGDLGSGTQLLMAGNFAEASTFTCCSGAFPVYTSAFSGLLQVTSLDAGLASALGFNLPATGASLAQVQIRFGSAPTTYGQAFSGIQGGGALAVTDSPAQGVPEPSVVLMLAMGMLGLVAWKRFYAGGGSHAS